MIFKDKPIDFDKKFDIVGCFMQNEDKFLLLRRHSHKANGEAWGLPAGKKEVGETLDEAVLREIREETGLELQPADLHFFGSYLVRDRNFDMEWHMFSTAMSKRPEVTINPYEHSEFRWVNRYEASNLRLIHDLPESIEIFFAKKA